MYTVEGTLLAWLHAAGNRVHEGDPIAEIGTEKATYELEAPASGILFPVAEIGANLPVEAILGYILADGEVPPDSPAPTPPQSGTRAPGSSGSEPTATSPPAARSRRPASPLARRLAAERGILLESLHGSGPGGRILESDVRAAIQSGPEPISSSRDLTTPGILRSIPFTGMRKVIADRLLAGLSATAPVTITCEADAGSLIRARVLLGQTHGIEVPYDALFVRILAAALRDHPDLNAEIKDNSIVVYEDIHIAIAIAVPGGIRTPVIRHADKQPLTTIASLISELRERALAGQLRDRDVENATVTLSNLGAYGVDAFTPILNPPQSAILGIGRIAGRPVVIDNCLAAGHTCFLSLTFDHRICDGVPAAQLLSRITQLMADVDFLAAQAGT